MSTDPASPHHRPTLICNGFADDNRGGAALTIATLEALRASGAEHLELLALADDLSSYPCTTGWDDDLTLRTRADVGVQPSRARLVLCFLLALVPSRLARIPLGRQLIRRAGRRLVPTIDTYASVVLKPGYVLVTRNSPGSFASVVTTTSPLVAGWAVGLPTIGLGHSVVLANAPENRWERLSSFYVTRLLRKMTAISVRDQPSYDDVAAATSGAATHLRLFPDVALMYPWPHDDPEPADDDGVFRIGLAAGHGAPGPTEDEYIDAVVRLADGRPTRVSIIQQSTDRRDIERAETIRQRLVRRGIMTRTFRPPPDLLSSIALWREVDVAITARMHAAIFCVLMNTPVRLLEADPRKALEVLRTGGLAGVIAADVNDITSEFSEERYDDEVAAAHAHWPPFIDWLADQLAAIPRGRRP